MQSEDAKYLKRKIRSRTIDVHPTEQALVVNYELEALILGDLGDPLLGDKKECQKIIRLKSLNAGTDCAALAKEVVGKCSLIHPNKLEEVEHLIYYLQKRSCDTSLVASNNNAEGESPRPNSSSSSSESYGNQVENASITDIEHYNELLYEDLSQKVKGSAFILSLARNPDNLYELSQNDVILSALARVLREDWKQSLELAKNIAFIFFCFSKYSVFHDTIILQYKVGSLCMEVIDSELRRHDQLKDDLEGRRSRLEGSSRRSVDGGRGQSPDVHHETRRRPSEGHVSHIPISHIPVSHIPVPQSHIPVPGDGKRHPQSAADAKRRTPEQKEEARTLREDYESRKQKFEFITKKQEQLLRISFFLLMNIAENTKVEDKMRKKNIVGMLVKTFSRDNPELLILVATFLKKLSLFRENVDDMRDLHVIEMFPRILAMDNANLIDVTLRLMFNLSFDMESRERMIRSSLLPKLVSLMDDERYINTVLKLLYHLSMDDRYKAMFAFTPCVATAVDMVLSEELAEPDHELAVALCVNLAINKRNAQAMVEQDRLEALMTRAFRNQDSTLMKLLRNISQHDTTKINFIEFVGDIANVIVDSEKEDFVVECVGVLGNMTIPDLDFREIMLQMNLVPWVLNVLIPGKFEDDLVLDVVVLLGTSAADQGCAELLCKADVLVSLIELLKAKQEDDEMVLQIIYVFYQVLRHPATRGVVISETDAPAYLLDLMHDKSTRISRVCKDCLDIISECDQQWADRVKTEKFRWYNSQWLEMVEVNVDAMGGGDSEEMPSYDNDLLEAHMFQQNDTHLGTRDDAIWRRYLNEAEDVPFLSSSRMSLHSSSEDLVIVPNLASVEGTGRKVH